MDAVGLDHDEGPLVVGHVEEGVLLSVTDSEKVNEREKGLSGLS